MSNFYDRLFGTVACIVIAEAARRKMGWSMPVLAVLFTMYGYFGEEHARNPAAQGHEL
jgi:TRAP-type uncharacterized transport system fused permease subunit